MRPTTDSTPSPLFARPAALRFAFALLAGLTLVVGLAVADKARRGQLETVAETTSVGDTAYFKIPDPAKLPVIGATLHGQPLHVVSAETIEVRDTHTLRVDHDAASGLTIYQLSPAATDEERDRAEKGRKAYLLKTEPGEYVKAQVAAP